jgi:hypothetical protein
VWQKANEIKGFLKKVFNNITTETRGENLVISYWTSKQGIIDR